MIEGIENSVRPFSEPERRLLSATVKRCRARLRTLLKRQLTAGLLIFGALWALTMKASGIRWYIITAVWIGIGGMITLWVYLTEKAKQETALGNYEAALQQNKANVVRIRSSKMVEFEEEEDEGACYAFQLADDQIIFVSGQDFYASARFPSSDFSLVHIYGADGVLVESFIEKYGTKLEPVRRVSANAKSRLKIPDHLQVIKGNVDDLEELLRSK